MNAWIMISQWFTSNFTNMIGCGIVLGIVVVTAFLTWLIARHSWKCHENARLPEIARRKLRDRDETIFHLRHELALRVEQVETLSANQRAAVAMIHQGCGVLLTPAIDTEIDISHRRKAR